MKVFIYFFTVGLVLFSSILSANPGMREQVRNRAQELQNENTGTNEAEGAAVIHNGNNNSNAVVVNPQGTVRDDTQGNIANNPTLRNEAEDVRAGQGTLQNLHPEGAGGRR